MDVEEATHHPSGENVMSYVAKRLEREGILPTGAEVLGLVAEKLEKAGIRLSPYCHQMYISKVCVEIQTVYKVIITATYLHSRPSRFAN